eukprot:403362002
MVDNQAFISEAKVLIQIGDSHYLEKLLSQYKLTSQSHYQQFLSKLKTQHDFDMPQQICKHGNLEMLKFFRQKLGEKDQRNPKGVFNMDFIDESGQNCLHYAVQRGHHQFVKHLLFEDKNSINVNQQTTNTKESPIFFALGKIKSDSEKLKMVKILLERNDLNINLTNSDNKYAFEAHQNQFGADEAANLVEKAQLIRQNNEIRAKENVLAHNLHPSYTYLTDFSKTQLDQLVNKQTQQQSKEQIIESHIFRQSEDFDYRLELQNQLKLSKKLQEKLKNLQGQQIIDPFKYIDGEELKKQLDKKLMEFIGMSLIQNIRDAFN